MKTLLSVLTPLLITFSFSESANAGKCTKGQERLGCYSAIQYFCASTSGSGGYYKNIKSYSKYSKKKGWSSTYHDILAGRKTLSCSKGHYWYREGGSSTSFKCISKKTGGRCKASTYGKKGPSRNGCSLTYRNGECVIVKNSTGRVLQVLDGFSYGYCSGNQLPRPWRCVKSKRPKKWNPFGF